MCAIVGWLSGGDFDRFQRTFPVMMGALAHRGPDSHGHWFDAAAGVALGHRRLSILDLSSAGHQPMASSQGRFVLVFNGEIYNHLELRRELEASALAWRGHSDTETMLAAFEAWGVERALKKFVGMFALALWDRQERALILARDRMGEKPLYYGYAGKTLLFASELKGLRAFPDFSPKIDREAVALMLNFSYIPTPYSIYKGVRKIEPGCWIRFTLDDVSEGRIPTPTPYWSLTEAAEKGLSDPFLGSEEEAATALEDVLKRAVSGQMLSDVPLGAFLSGGIDSSTIVALMQSQSSRPVKTFTIGFHEKGWDEAGHAKAVARHLGTEHTELYVTAGQALEVIPRLARIYDEPFSDASQIPTYLLSQLARQHVVVSLSGDAGDELFGGYARYLYGNRLKWGMSVAPLPVRRSIAKALIRIPSQSWDGAFDLVRPLLPSWARNIPLGHKVHKLAGVLRAESEKVLYRQFISYEDSFGGIVIGANGHRTALEDSNFPAGMDNFLQRMMWLDSRMYLPDDILVKVDRAAMAVSLETRVPMLDQRVVEFAWRLPLSMKIRKGQGKWLLRQVLNRYVPRRLIERPKMGFGVPLDHWLRGPLRDWAEGLLAENRLRQEGYFDSLAVRQIWNEHLSGKRNWQGWLWGVLMFQAWLEEHHS